MKYKMPNTKWKMKGKMLEKNGVLRYNVWDKQFLQGAKKVWLKKINS